MTWDGLAGSDVTGHLSPFDSARFGLRVARIIAGHGVIDALSAAREIDSTVRSLAPDLSIVRWPAELSRVGQALVGRGHTLVPADTLMYWEGFLDGPLSSSGDVTTIDDTPDLSAKLGHAVRRIFAGYINHYAASDAFDPEDVLDGYVDWAIRNASERPLDTFVLLQGATGLEGFATTSAVEGGRTLEVNLAGVVPEARGRGRYGDLLTGVMARSRDGMGYRRLVISTQASNTRVQASWARLGLRPFAAFTTVHLTGLSDPGR